MLSDTVEQFYYVVRESDKPEILCKLIDLADDFYGLVFCQTKALVMDLTQYLAGKNYKVDCLHGDKSQEERERAMRAFRDKKTRLLICTDVAAPGLDVKDLTHVINYSIPRELELYVHRIGRTARSGKAGIAISLVTPATRALVNRVEHLTKTRLQEGKIPGRREVAAKKISKLCARFEAQNDFQRAIDLLGPDWERAAGDMTLGEVIGPLQPHARSGGLRRAREGEAAAPAARRQARAALLADEQGLLSAVRREDLVSRRDIGLLPRCAPSRRGTSASSCPT